jgi:hypothetical protein
MRDTYQMQLDVQGLWHRLCLNSSVPTDCFPYHSWTCPKLISL